jgi:hypothetical protein
MVFFALTRFGYDELVRVLGHTPSPLWINQGVLTLDERAQLRTSGIDLTDFVERIDPNNHAAVRNATNTVREHHPDASIWVESCDEQ